MKTAGIDIGTTTISGVVLEKGENGQRPEDIEEIFQDYVDKLTSAYTSSDFNYEDYLDQYMNQ